MGLPACLAHVGSIMIVFIFCHYLDGDIEKVMTYDWTGINITDDSNKIKAFQVFSWLFIFFFQVSHQPISNKPIQLLEIKPMN